MSKELIVEIKGIGFPNKGAELMLVAVMQAFAEQGVSAKFAIEPQSDYRIRAQYGLFTIARVIKKGVNFASIFTWLPRKMLNVFGIVNPRHIDVVLDASGFAYGDQWGPKTISQRLGNSVVSLVKRGTKVILLPQALGPFSDNATRDVAANIFNHAHAVFARDGSSFAYASDIAPNANIHQCVDFTNAIKGEYFSGFDAQKHQHCFIPNAKMLEKTTTGNEYLQALADMVNACQQKGGKPFFLIHEGRGDAEIAEKINASLTVPVDILEPVDPLKIKWVIGQSDIVVSSRFHGLVSALSQSVPVIAMGWSHKYQHLLADYGCESDLFDPASQKDQMVARLEELLSPVVRHSMASALTPAAAIHKQSVADMWQQVFRLIGK